VTRKRHDCDSEATETAHFEDSRSYITHDGHQFLFGPDITNRRQEVYDRDRGICRGCRKPVGWSWGHMHHVLHRGKGGSDDLENLAWACPTCHGKEHLQVKWGKYPDA
jgi:hypothetical protein